MATDVDFNDVVVNETDLTETRYTLTTVVPGTTYYWRVQTTNYGGTGNWSTQSFTAVAPSIQVTTPNGTEVFQRGLDSFILWNDNLIEDVVIELVKGDTPVKEITTKASAGAYEWEVDLDLEPGSDNRIKIKSSEDETITDSSDAYPTVVGSPGPGPSRTHRPPTWSGLYNGERGFRGQ